MKRAWTVLIPLLALLGATGPVAAGIDPSFWMPVQGSSIASRVDWIFYLILGISVVFFLLIVFLMVFFVLRYRRRKGRTAEKTASHHTGLELTWSIIPLILVIVIFFFGFKGYMDMAVTPQNALEILVTAQKWSWQFTYPNGYVDATLHVPVNRPIQLVLQSEDVIHSFYVPAFRVKKDVVPGRYNKAWFEATVPGEFALLCAEYCGTQHSDMTSTIVVHEPGGFEKWLADASDFLDKIPPAEAGERLYRSRGCVTCHSVDGRAGIGPTFQGLFGHEVILSDGSKVVADEDYIRSSILNPAGEVVAGYDAVMPTYQGRIKDKEITVIIEYIKTLK